MNTVFAKTRVFSPQRVIIHHLYQAIQSLVVGQIVKLHTRCRGSRIGVIPDQIAPPHFNRVHSDFGRGVFQKTICDGHRDRMPDCPVLTHHVLVLEHHLRFGAVILDRVRRSGQIQHLIGLDRRGARIHRIRADACDIVKRQRSNMPIRGDGDPSVDNMITGVNIGQETLQPVGDILYRTAKDLCRSSRCNIIAIGMNLNSERAANIL